MLSMLTGFVTIAIVIAVGFLVGHLRLFDLRAQELLARLSFFVASPALMITTIGKADVHTVLSRNLLASVASVAAVVVVYVILAGVIQRRERSDVVVGTLSSSYVNAGNLGIPVAAYVLGDASAVAPTLMLQLLLMQPVALVLLDRWARGHRRSILQTVAQPFTNPLTVGTLIGLVLAITGWRLPDVIAQPVTLIGQMAVPAMLIAYGIALRLGPKLGGDGRPRDLALTSALKLLVQPFVAYAVGHWMLGMEGHALLAVVITAALPTAQNIFVIATRYRVGTTLSRDTILITTFLSVPVILAAAFWIGR